jgi:uncharacterized repeat protein (TIGR01451 family)
MVTIRRILLIIFLFANNNILAEGSYELREKTSANDEVRIDGRRDGFSGNNSFGLPRVTIFYVDIMDADNELIDLYTSNPDVSSDRVDIAVWCPSNKPSNPEGSNAHQSADKLFDVKDRNNSNGYISSWSDVVSVQSINSRVRNPVTFNPSSEGCGEGVYTVRFYTAGTTSDTFSTGLRYMDIAVRDSRVNTLRKGRVFSDHYSLIVNGFGSQINFQLYAVEAEDFFDYYEGYVWRVDANGIQPFGFQLISNNVGANPIVYNDDSVHLSSNPNPLLKKQYNIYLNYPDKQVRLPNSRPNVSNFFYNNICPDDQDSNGFTNGGYFNFYSNGIWKYKLYIDINGDNQVNLNEKVFQGTASIGLNKIYWDGILPNGQIVQNGTEIKFNLYLSDGEIHFPWIDVENNQSSTGPIIELMNTSTSDSNYYYWNDTRLSNNATTSINGSLSTHIWGGNLGNNALIDTWKYAYNDGLQKSVIYGGECQNPDLGGNVSGFVFDDINHNGSKDGGEQGIEDVTIVLHNLTNNDCETQKTDENGYFLFDNILVSEFNLVESANETLPIAFNCPPNEEDPSGYISVDDNTKPVVFNELNASYITFANFKGYKVEGKTFVDNGLGSNQPHNGIQDGAEENFGNIKLDVLSGNTIIDTEYSKAGGEFEFWIPDNFINVKIQSEEKLDFKNVSSGVGNTGGTINNYKEITLNNVTNKKSGIRFGYVQDPSIVANQSKTIQAGTTTTYTHRYRINNIGNVSFSLENEQKNPSNININSILYHDINCNGTIEQSIDSQNITNISANINNTNEICLIVKILTTLNSPNNSSYSFNIQAETDYINIPIIVTENVQDITIITNYETNSNLILIKAVDKSNASPNEIISYTVTAKNTGQDILNSIIINDYTPDFTNFVSAACPLVLPSNISNCTIIELPNTGEKGAVKWSFIGNLNTNEELTVFYQVRVDN